MLWCVFTIFPALCIIGAAGFYRVWNLLSLTTAAVVMIRVVEGQNPARP
jgi:hypothetical protein